MLETLLVKPLFNTFLFLYAYIPGHDFGVVVVAFTVLVRVLLWPLFAKSIRSQLIMSKLQPAIQEIQKKHKDNKQEQVAALMNLYRENRFNPFSGFVSLFIQLPILIAVYQVFRLLASPFERLVYPQVPIPEVMNHTFLGMFDLLQPFFAVTVLAALLQFAQVLMSLRAMPKTDSKDPNTRASRMTAYLSPVLTVVVLRSLPSVLSLYWSVSSLVSLAQQWYVQKQLKKNT